MAWIFQQTFGASSGLGFITNVNMNRTAWERYTSVTLTVVLIFVGDALLVGSVPMNHEKLILMIIILVGRYIAATLCG